MKRLIKARLRSAAMDMLRSRSSAFAREESGAMVIFAVYIFVMMLMVVGIGVDLMHAERDRTNLQYTLDRAVLAAADMDQPLSPSGVVADYFDKAGLSEYLSSVSATGDLSFRMVTASATAPVTTQFMHMTGVDTLNVNAFSVAEERIDAVEITLVLDVSGSMNSNRRLTNLKIAAKDFVDEMFDNSPPNKVSISIVPYATQVSLPAQLADQFNISNEHSYSNCVNFAAADFATTAITPTQPLERTMHFDPWYDFDGRSDGELVRSPVCEALTSREMTLFQHNRNALKRYIDDLTARGNTSIDIGMKWGAATLDPSFRPAVQALTGHNVVAGMFNDRPAEYTDPNTIKVVVLMTDGQNTSQYFINPGYRTGLSNIWWSDDDEMYSVFDPAQNRYFVPGLNQWLTLPFGNEPPALSSDCQDAQDNLARELARVPTNNRRLNRANRAVARECGVGVFTPASEQLSYADLWAYTTVAANARDNYYPWMNDSQAWRDWYSSVISSVGNGTKNARTQTICNAAKANQIIVFTIGFEAPSDGRNVLRDCASSPSHFFDVEGLEIADAFSAIASSIRALRLTQ